MHSPTTQLNRRVCIAPMMDYTDRHFRVLARLLSPRALLYTEMVTTGALLHGDAAQQLAYSAPEHPLALQLGGSDPQALARAAKMGSDAGYDEINLNVGCPSDRVTSGRFGACLMAEPRLVAECVAAMRGAVPVPVTVKTRLGIDNRDSYTELCQFIATVAASGCDTFILHARKAWLTGLSSKENRELPPLNYPRVFQVKRDFPHLTIVINGGIKSAADAHAHLQQVDGVMIGREAYANPWLLRELAVALGDHPASGSRVDTLLDYQEYVRAQTQQGVKAHHLLRHVLGMFQGQPHARLWRRYLSERMPRSADGAALLDAALEMMHTR